MLRSFSTSTRELSPKLQTEEVKDYAPLNPRDYIGHFLFLYQSVRCCLLTGIHDHSCIVMWVLVVLLGFGSPSFFFERRVTADAK